MTQRLVIAILTVALTAGALAGCTKVSTQTGTPGQAGGVVHGVLRIGNNAEPDNMNPVVGNQQIETDLSMFWGGYLLIPETVEFWQSGRYRLHDRLRYRRHGDRWIIERLSPYAFPLGIGPGGIASQAGG